MQFLDTLEIQPQTARYKFSDIGGCEIQSLEVCRLAMHLKHPEIHSTLGIQPPNGILLHGPPGCGKTMFAEAIAGEFELPFIRISSTELVAGVSGETEEKIRSLFQKAAQLAPCLLLLDEVDIIAQKRENAQRDMERRVVTQLIACLDDIGKSVSHPDSSKQGLIIDTSTMPIHPPKHFLVIGTTSRLEVIDSALRRAGRFDKELALGIPDERTRTKILEIVCRGLRMDSNISMKALARLTPGYVGADLQALSREAALTAVNRLFENILNSTKKRHQTIDEVNLELQKMLSFLNSNQDLNPNKFDDLFIRMEDFQRALAIIHPSAKREGFATVPDVSWQDIGALKDVRNDLEWSILYPIKRPEDFELLGVSTRPQGILLCGPPGCGKTLLAKAIANETGMNFISVKGPELLSMYVGESERAVRTVFQRAHDSAPCVIFFDELDALVPTRSMNESTGSARLVNQLLTEMDGIQERQGVFIIGATNRPDIVDPAILRPGRLDKILFVDFPNAAERADILRKATKNCTRPKVAADVDLDAFSQNPAMEYFSGADITAFVHEASLLALKERLASGDERIDSIQRKHFEEALHNVKPSVNPDDRERYKKMKAIYTRNNS
uniref:AAA+ ATPase domain-containing protein n=2 Tax=Acrobeloides nanus TaxID=290746 RepID=A0A914DUY4_9BILA